MKKTMRKSALLSSVAMLIVSAIVLTSATYAWFSSSKVVQVQQLSTKVTVTTGLLVSVDKGTTWGTSVNFANHSPVKDGWGTGVPQVFEPVSTSDGMNWMSAIFEDGALKKAETAPVPGTNGDFIAVPFWVTGPENANVEANITFNVNGDATAKCVKFALVKTSDGVTATEYTEAVAATANADNKFMGVSAVGTGTDTTENSAYVTDGGTEITEVDAAGGIDFTIPVGTSTTAPIKYIAYLWLEGNDADCAMLNFNPAGETINFEMTLNIVE